jgi:hypothetical protein
VANIQRRPRKIAVADAETGRQAPLGLGMPASSTANSR